MNTFDGPGTQYYQPPEQPEGCENQDMATLAREAEKCAKSLCKKWRYAKRMCRQIDEDVEGTIEALGLLATNADAYRAPIDDLADSRVDPDGTDEGRARDGAS